MDGNKKGGGAVSDIYDDKDKIEQVDLGVHKSEPTYWDCPKCNTRNHATRNACRSCGCRDKSIAPNRDVATLKAQLAEAKNESKIVFGDFLAEHNKRKELEKWLRKALEQGGKICNEVMTEMADLYSNPEIPEQYRIKIKYLCELKMAEIQSTCSFWAKELKGSRV